jgi:hypothetical protein
MRRRDPAARGSCPLLIQPYLGRSGLRVTAEGDPRCCLGDAVGLGVGTTQGQPQPRTVVGWPQGSVDRSQRSVEHDLVDAGVVVEVLDVA